MEQAVRQIGVGDGQTQRFTNPQAGHIEKCQSSTMHHAAEWRAAGSGKERARRQESLALVARQN